MDTQSHNHNGTGEGQNARHVGFMDYRLTPEAGNPREVAFAKQWKIENRHDDFLQYLIGRFPTDTEARIAATVIQWLGSNVGMTFLRDVIRGNPDVRDWLKSELSHSVPSGN